ncbi:hypothetical protein SI65_00549 [Aspergillus cristatus]|uniref:Uncharacterized protein n=1 Tax=Aspergillus cristatus TaxID=573508 RepID=A0A1E3BPS4_ASPCR|nr:hypothetical protein SI65_00549 [Aspergillus cristatus]
MTLQAIIAQGNFPSLSDTEAVNLFGSAFRSELERLRNAEPTVESGTVKPAGSLKNGETPSRQLFQADYAEVNRTLVNILALKWILAEDYASFTACQRDPGKLSEDSFRRLCEFFKSYKDIYTLLVAVVTDDLGKDPQLANELEKTRNGPTMNVKMANRSEFLYEAAKAGMIPALESVPVSGRETILRSMEIEVYLNISQLVQGENVPASLSILRNIQDGGNGFHMRAMVTILDVAGAAAHSNARGCLVMTESVYQGYMTAIEALEKLVLREIPSERACYDQVLSKRARNLHMKGYDLLSTNNAEERALLRILCMGRVDNKQSADLFNKAFAKLSTTENSSLVNGLNVDGLEDGIAILPYYAPGLIAEVLRGAQRREEPAIIEALSAFMRFMARVVEYKSETGESRVIERDLSFVQDIIKSNGFKNDPYVLDKVQLPWSQ